MRSVQAKLSSALRLSRHIQRKLQKQTIRRRVTKTQIGRKCTLPTKFCENVADALILYVRYNFCGVLVTRGLNLCGCLSKTLRVQQSHQRPESMNVTSVLTICPEHQKCLADHDSRKLQSTFSDVHLNVQSNLRNIFLVFLSLFRSDILCFSFALQCSILVGREFW